MHRCLFFLLILSVAGCDKPDVAVQLRFEAQLGGAPTACGESLPTLSDLRFYVSELELSTASGDWVPARLEVVSPWQNEQVALIDLEDSSASCDNGTAPLNASVHVLASEGDYDAIRFTVGVPFDVNHANPLTAEPPLNDGAMHWHWRSGYKFLRAGIATSDGETWIHLGSTGCEGTVGDISGCSSPNRVKVELQNFDPDTDRIAVNLSSLLDEAAIRATGDRLDCSSGPAEVACGPPFAALGLAFGVTEASSPQRVFSVAP